MVVGYRYWRVLGARDHAGLKRDHLSGLAFEEQAGTGLAHGDGPWAGPGVGHRLV